jgi:hypothetical protein
MSDRLKYGMAAGGQVSPGRVETGSARFDQLRINPVHSGAYVQGGCL